MAVSISVPRFALSYPMYLLSALLVVDYKRTSASSYLKLVALFGVSALGTLIATSEGTISPVAFVIEWAFLLPLLMFVCGFQVMGEWRTVQATIRLINLVFLVLSAVSVLRAGFPERIPYINLHPDVFSAAYGPGGARSVTIIGFFGIMGELTALKRGERPPKWRLFIAMFNFLAPSYIIGICCGLLAFALTQAKTFLRLVGIAVVAVPSIYYATIRLNSVNHIFFDKTGYNPKEVPFLLPGEVWGRYPQLAFLGTGPGQFTSTPQNWQNTGLRAVSLHAVPHVPGLNQSTFAQVVMDRWTYFANDFPAALSSAISKPYNGMETLLVEWGLVGVIILIMFLRQVRQIARVDSTIWMAAFFFIALNFADLWTDNLWLGLGLLLARGMAMSSHADQQTAKSISLRDYLSETAEAVIATAVAVQVVVEFGVEVVGADRDGDEVGVTDGVGVVFAGFEGVEQVGARPAPDAQVGDLHRQRVVAGQLIAEQFHERRAAGASVTGRDGIPQAHEGRTCGRRLWLRLRHGRCHSRGTAGEERNQDRYGNTENPASHGASPSRPAPRRERSSPVRTNSTDGRARLPFPAGPCGRAPARPGDRTG